MMHKKSELKIPTCQNPRSNFTKRGFEKRMIFLVLIAFFSLILIPSLVSAAVTYASGSNRITITGNKTGSTPWDFQSLYDADKAGTS